MSKHTPEPWEAVEPSNWYGTAILVRKERGDPIAQIPLMGWPIRVARANAERIVACVNACKGINPEAVPDLLAALEQLCDTIHADGRPMEHKFAAGRAAIALARKEE